MRTAPADTYASAADLALSLPGDKLAKLEEKQPGVGLAMLRRAAGLVRGRIGARYPLPLTAWDEDLVGLVCDIAAWFTLVGAGGYKPEAELREDPYWKRYNEALATLNTIRAGELELSIGGAPAASGDPPEPSTGGAVLSDPLEGW